MIRENVYDTTELANFHSRITRLKGEKERGEATIERVEVLKKQDNRLESVEELRAESIKKFGVDVIAQQQTLDKNKELQEKTRKSRENIVLYGDGPGASGGLNVENLADMLVESGETNVDEMSLPEMMQKFLEIQKRDKIDEITLVNRIGEFAKGLGEDAWGDEDEEERTEVLEKFNKIMNEQFKVQNTQAQAVKQAQEAVDSSSTKEQQEIKRKYEELYEVKGKGQEGGRIPETGLYQLHAGEMVFDPLASNKIDNFVASYLPQSGAVINQLQADKTLGGVTGTSEPVIIDNSSQPTIINQTNIASPQTRGNPLPGMGRDLGVTHLKYG